MNIQLLNKAVRRQTKLENMINDRLDMLPEFHQCFAIEHNVQSIKHIMSLVVLHHPDATCTEDEAQAIQEAQKFYKRIRDIEFDYVDSILDKLVDELELTNPAAIREALEVFPGGFHRSKLCVLLHRMENQK